MSWLILALSAAIFSAVMDFFIKISSGKIHVSLSGFIINFSAALVLLFFLLWSKLKGEEILSFKTNGLIWSVLAGIAVGLATVAILRMYELGTNLSLGSPIIRIGAVVLAVALGILFLKESINFRFIVGFAVSLLGLYLLAGK